MPPVLCDYYESFGHDGYNCPHCDHTDATYASVKKTINELTDKMVDTTKEQIAE